MLERTRTREIRWILSGLLRRVGKGSKGSESVKGKVGESENRNRGMEQETDKLKE